MQILKILSQQYSSDSWRPSGNDSESRISVNERVKKNSTKCSKISRESMANLQPNDEKAISFQESSTREDNTANYQEVDQCQCDGENSHSRR